MAMYIKYVKDNLRKFFKSELITHTVVVFIGTSLVGVFNLLYHLISVRLLIPEDYGTFNALISVVMLTSVAITPMGTSFTRFFTEYITRKDFATLIFTLRKISIRLVIGALAIFLIFFIFSPILGNFLKTAPLYINICGAIIAVSLLALPLSPLFQSLQKFKIYSIIGVLSSLGKIVFGAVFMFLGWKVLGSLLGFLVSPLLIIICSFLFIPEIFKKEINFTNELCPNKGVLVPIYKYFFPASLALFSFTMLTNVDVILVKHFFYPLYAGYYSIAQMVGKIFLFLPSALAIVIFPKSTEAYVKKSNSNSILYKSLMLAAVCCGIGVVLCYLFPDLILNILTSKTNPVSSKLVGLFSLTMSFNALLFIVINFLLATHNLKFIMPLLTIAILQTIFIYNFHFTLFMVLNIFFSFSVISFTTSLFIAICRRRNKKINVGIIDCR